MRTCMARSLITPTIPPSASHTFSSLLFLASSVVRTLARAPAGRNWRWTALALSFALGDRSPWLFVITARRW
ncbi:hypothetical protein C2E23DRAFT_552011 [Lenzites betulinus]|nr:hypothetical protein C2E23DRAFT_552011 [Lenzites betulinus]